MDRKQEVLRIFPQMIREMLANCEIDFADIQEIRIRVQTPILFICANQEYYLSKTRGLTLYPEDVVIGTRELLQEILQLVSGYSLYAYEEELRQGFLTIQGGHRVGIAGKTVLENQSIRSMKYISFLNIRLAHEVKGCADQVLPYIRRKDSIYQTLIISPPCCGKTTLLRDLIRQLSDGNSYEKGMTVGVVDERSEIGACCMGIPQNDVGMRTDILDCCPKALGMMMLIRTMSPQIIAVDEVGSRADLEAMEYVVNCGIKLIATVHGSSMEDIRSKPVLREMVNQRLFERYVVFDGSRGVGKIGWIFDFMGNLLYEAESV
ncbi:MAG: stage III sporulation protein AA [Lachnospiraceae bacterium]